MLLNSPYGTKALRKKKIFLSRTLPLLELEFRDCGCFVIAINFGDLRPVSTANQNETREILRYDYS